MPESGMYRDIALVRFCNHGTINGDIIVKVSAQRDCVQTHGNSCHKFDILRQRVPT